MESVVKLCVRCGIKPASKRRNTCSSCKNAHLADVIRLCIDCGINNAAPGRRICWNCKLKRNLTRHPENIEKANQSRNRRYEIDANGFRTKRLKAAAKYRLGREADAAAYAREWRALYPEKVRINNILWRERHPEYGYLNGRAWAQANPERIRHSNRLRKARLRQATIGTLTLELWVERLDYFNHCCGYCLGPLVEVTMEHMTPIAQGGLHDIDNVVPACGSCNSSKNDKNLLEWLLYQTDVARITGK